jgi:hypothetical protein
VCTGHCTVQCPVHRQPRAKISFSCALSGGSPDSYCALSGVHRTGTVDCPVRPYSVFKKTFPLSRPRPGSFLLCSQPLLSVSGGFLSLAGDHPSPAISSPAATKCFSPSLSGEHPLLSLSSFLSELLPPEKLPSSSPYVSFSNSCEFL